MNIVTVFVVIASVVAPVFSRGLDGSKIEQSYNNSHGRIIWGNLAERKQFPYQVGLRLYASKGHSWCGGAIITNRWILTAAQCTDFLTTGLDAYLGTWNREDPDEEGQQVIFVEKRNVIVHEGWNPTTLENDISLIKLPVPVEFNEYIQKIKLELAEYIDIESGSYASGWGRTEFGASTDKLRYIKAKTIKNDECLLHWGDVIKPTNLCIRNQFGRSTCDGDIGGPLVDMNNKNLQGITSFMAPDCGAGWPAVFTRTRKYQEWISLYTGIKFRKDVQVNSN